MSGTDTADAPTKTVEELQEELKANERKYTNLNTAHEKLKQDHSNLKSQVADVSELQKQISNHVSDKTKLLKDLEELKTTFDTYRGEVKAKETKDLITSKLEEAGARSPTTALKLIDLEAIKFDDKGQVVPETIESAINALKESDGILFAEDPPSNGKVTTPAVRHAVDKLTQSAYETEIAAAVKAKDQKRLDEVFAKYRRS